MSLDSLLSVFTSLFHFLVVLGLAVIFHEWGHFIVAKLSGAKVDEFAVGFGKKLFARTWHETEYSVRALPLGGLVKIRGMDFDEELTGAEWEFLQLPPWKRILIVVAGPIMNFVLAYLLYVLLLFSFGKTYTATTIIGFVPGGSMGWEIGLRDGDKILSVNGHEVASWEDVWSELSTHIIIIQNEMDQGKDVKGTALQTIPLKVERDGASIDKELTLSDEYLAILKNQIDKKDQIKPPAGFDGVFITDVNPHGPAGQAGLKPGYTVISTNGVKIDRYGQWADLIFESYEKLDDGTYRPKPLNVVCHDPEGATQTVAMTPVLKYPAEDAIPYQPKPRLLLSYEDRSEITVKDYFLQNGSPGIILLDVSPKLKPVIGTVLEGSPAQRAGLTSGCQIVKMDDRDIDDWRDVLDFIHSAPVTKYDDEYTTSPIEMTWYTPDNEMRDVTITPNVEESPLLTPQSMKTGKNYTLVQLGIDRKSERKKMGVIGAVTGGWNSMMNVFGFMFDFLYKLFTGNVSPKLLGGPIAIFQLSGETGRWGLERFLGFIALLSVNLGILNLFPLPPFDGGHTVFYLVEIVRRKPLTMKQMETFSKIGFALIIPLFIWLIFNDLSRTDLFGWVKKLFSFSS